MRAAVILAIAATLVLAAAWNANQLLDALIALYSYPPARKLLAWMLALIAAGLAVGALICISRHGYAQAEKDFPETWKDRP